MRVQMVRTTVWLMEGRSALATARDLQGSEREERLAVVTRAAQRVAAERLTWGTAAASLLDAGVAMIRGDDARAALRLRDAARDASSAKMALMEATAKHALGVCAGGDEGRRLVSESVSALAAAGAKQPERLIAMTAGGFTASG